MTISQRQLLLLLEIQEAGEHGLHLKQVATHYFATVRSLIDLGWVRIRGSRMLLSSKGELRLYRLTNTSTLDDLRIRKPVDRERVSQMRKIA